MAATLSDRCIGCLLCHMIGDQLGAGVEGFSAARIKREIGMVRDDIKAPHMGIPELGPRIHMYTDDTNAMLALANSLVVNEGLKAKHAAQSYAQFWSTGVKRGYPDSAQVMVSRDFIHHNTDRDTEVPQTISDRDRRIPEKTFHRVSHFNPTGIALTALFYCSSSIFLA
ncbi:unnamed protein product [Rotaria magnacalcarata]|uniref:Uncharacterized protein n=1 Tax=Rotaria magnacalcarata TaxID=392030 RepID=A0A815FN29_9BILA|nr:unnamed protein product [Rotaria magnacalcarata]